MPLHRHYSYVREHSKKLQTGLLRDAVVVFITDVRAERQRSRLDVARKRKRRVETARQQEIE